MSTEGARDAPKCQGDGARDVLKWVAPGITSRPQRGFSYSFEKTADKPTELPLSIRAFPDGEGRMSGGFRKQYEKPQV